MLHCSGLHCLYLSGRIKGVFPSPYARVRDAGHRWRTHSVSRFPLVIVYLPISPFARRSGSGSRPRRLKESVYILCGCPTSWKALKILADCSFHRSKIENVTSFENSSLMKYYFSGRNRLSCHLNLYLTCGVFISNHLAENRSHRLSSTSVHTHWYQPVCTLAAISHFFGQQRNEDYLE